MAEAICRTNTVCEDEVLAIESIFGLEHCHVVRNETHLRLSLGISIRSDNPVTVEVWTPVELETQLSRLSNEPDLSIQPKTSFARSDSGQRIFTRFCLTYFYPICFDVVYTDSSAHPNFTLSSIWLSRAQLSALCRKLDELSQENVGTPVLFIWSNFLETELLTFLGIGSSLVIRPEIDEGVFDPRAIRELENDMIEVVLSLLRHDIAESERAFDTAYHTCDICCDDRLLGSDCLRVIGCRHVFCRSCLGDYCRVQIADGSVIAMSCPAFECKIGLLPQQIARVTDRSTYERYERLIVEQALDGMADVIWCPRCQHAVIAETVPAGNAGLGDSATNDVTNGDSNASPELLSFGQCSQCMLAFCAKCKDPWHPGTRCLTAAERLLAIEAKSKGRSYSTPDQLLEQERLANLAVLDALSEMSKNESCLACPGCRAPIIKSAGCNKVVCTRCKTSMCYLCGASITSYDHFRDDRCPLFQDAHRPELKRQTHEPTPNELIEVRLQIEPTLVRNVVRCPLCAQRNLKTQRDNNIRCWQCKQRFCFKCRKPVTGMQHFVGLDSCPQHSDE